MAIALASHGPIQIGRYRSCSVSLRITTWRLDSMWTRTLSTTISTSPFRACGSSPARRGLSHAEPGRRPRRPAVPAPSEGPDDEADEGARDESSDMREERHLVLGRRRSERREAAQELQDEPQDQDDDRRHLDQLIEEAEEHQRQDARSRIQDEIGAEDRRDRAGRSDQRGAGRRVREDLAEGGHHPAGQVEQEEAKAAEAVLDVVAEDPQIEHVAAQVQPAAVEELARDQPEP